MYDAITGTVTRKDAGSVVLTAGGIGFRLSVPARTLERLPDRGEVTLYVHLSVKDDQLKLHGFETPFERDLFLQILGVSGIGAAIANNLLGLLTPETLMNALVSEDAAALQRVKGVGARTAKRLILELKDRVDFTGTGLPGIPADGETTGGGARSTLASDLVNALTALGYPRSAAKAAAMKTLAALPAEESLEPLIKDALQRI